ncbi:MAG: radical SAM protein [Chlamydiota bacterium]
MKSLTKLWGDFHSIPVDKNNLFLTRRLFLERLDDPQQKNDAIYVAVNTLSGAIDLFNETEGQYLLALRSRDHKEHRSVNDIPEKFLKRIKNRGYIFPEREYEDLVFETIVNKYKNKKSLSDKIISFFSIDMGCPVKCEYCFEKKYLGKANAFENATMDEVGMRAAFNVLEVIRNLQEKEIDFVAGWGGEPLQEKHAAMNELFINLAKEKNMPIAYFSSLVTMGTKLFNSLATHASNIKFLSTTLDAMPEIHNQLRQVSNAFEKTTRQIDKLLEADLPIVIRTNIGPKNLENIPKLAAFYEEKGWFEHPKFKAFVVKTYDRYHDNDQIVTYSEDEAMSQWLRLKDEYPAVRKMQTLKYAPSLTPILRAFELRESIDIVQDNFEVVTKPMITYCYTGNRTEYVFTGAPDYSIYNCAECTGISHYKIGTYYPHLSFIKEKKKMWDINDHFYKLRSIDTLQECKDCIANTHCGGYCSLEAISANGDSRKIYCNHIQNAIPNFIRRESARLYVRGRVLMDRSLNLTL